MAGEIYGKINSKITIKKMLLVCRTYMKLNPHYSENNNEKVGEGEGDNNFNDEYVYLLMERATARRRW